MGNVGPSAEHKGRYLPPEAGVAVRAFHTLGVCPTMWVAFGTQKHQIEPVFAQFVAVFSRQGAVRLKHTAV